MNGKRLKLLTQILAILIICLISFVGIYKQNLNKVENKVKSYDLGNDLTGYRELTLKVSDATEVLDSDGKVVGNTDSYSDSDIESYSYQKSETKINKEEDLNLDNYKKVKSIIEERLKYFGVADYNISLDANTGTICLQIPENSTTNHTISNILQVAKFEIRDSEDTSKVYLTNDSLKNVSAAYNNMTTGTAVYLQLEFNKDGQNKLKELTSGEYATKKEEENQDTENTTDTENAAETENTSEGEANITSEETSSDENKEESENTEEPKEEQKKISIVMDGTELITSSFDEPIENGVISLTMGQTSTDADAINNTLTSASTVAAQLNTGTLPLTYTFDENRYIKTDISEDVILKCVIGIGVVAVIALIVLMIKYKFKGLIAAIAYIGFIAVDLLLIRYTNVYITVETIIAGVIVLAINYILVVDLLREKTEKTERIKEWAFKLMPIFLISIVFAFVRFDKIAEFGMFMFWGILLSTIYNYLLTRNMIEQ